PYYRSLEAASRFQRLGAELGVKKIVAVANKVKTDEDEKAIRQYCEKINLPVLEIIPYDEEIIAADQSGKSILDFNSSSKGLIALRKLAEKITLN
nr:cobyrinic acid a,c-diamide synthase [Nitrosopumilus sp.]